MVAREVVLGQPSPHMWSQRWRVHRVTAPAGASVIAVCVRCRTTVKPASRTDREAAFTHPHDLLFITLLDGSERGVVCSPGAARLAEAAKKLWALGASPESVEEFLRMLLRERALSLK